MRLGEGFEPVIFAGEFEPQTKMRSVRYRVVAAFQRGYGKRHPQKNFDSDFPAARNHDVQTFWANIDFQARGFGARFAVGMNPTGLIAFDDERAALQHDDGGNAIEGAMEKAPEKREGVQEIHARNGGEIKQAVAERGTGGDEGVVAVLGGVGDGQRQRFHAGLPGGVMDRVGFRFIVPPRAEAGAEIAAEAAVGERGKTASNQRFKADSSCAEKRIAVDRARIHGHRFTFDEGTESAFARTGNTDVATESIARAAGNQAEDSGRAYEASGDLIHGAITTDGDHEGAAIGHGLPGEFRGVARMSRGDDRGVPVAFGDELRRAIPQVGIAAIGARVRIEDEPGFQGRDGSQATDGPDCTKFYGEE